MELIPIQFWQNDETGLIAVEVANKSTHKFKLGAIICNRRGKVVAHGYNDPRKGSTKWGSGKFMTLHAEGAALMMASKLNIDVSGMTMYIFRENGNTSKPCPSCQALLHKAKIKKVYYSSKNGN